MNPEARITDLFELQSRLIYSLVVAGKSAKFANAVMERWLDYCQEGELPFDMARRLLREKALRLSFKAARSGNYNKLCTAVRALVDSELDLSVCSPAQLETIPGFGPKTSRFFILWTRPDATYAALDVHILRWLRGLGYDAPVSTPQSSQKYAFFERIFLEEARKRGKTARELDLEIWSKASTAPNIV